MSGTQPMQISVKGRIHLGKELKLTEKVQPLNTASSFFDSGRPDGLPSVYYSPQLSRPGELPMQRLGYSLEENTENIYIDDDGLCLSYGIFGAPGSGKTNLVLHLLRQILSLNNNNQDLKYGALILDPKAALIDDVRSMMDIAGRKNDLVVINTDELNQQGSINVIDVSLDPYELGKQLVQAAQSAGTATSDPYWILAWGNVFGAALYLLSLDNYTVTLKKLMDSILIQKQDLTDSVRGIQIIARQMKNNLQNLSEGERNDVSLAVNQIENFFSQKNDNISTIEQLISDAYGPFQRSKYSCFSLNISKERAKTSSSFYDKIVDDGKIVLVSLSPSEPILAKTLCTLVKCLFQRSVLSRLERVRTGRLHNFKRPLIIACDEYSQIASEVAGKMGDGDFFSQSRQNGCMGILATQSVNVLQASSLKEHWKSVFSNFGAKIFMRLEDNETCEEATKLAGESDWYVTSQGTSRSKDGLSTSSQKELRERKTLPTEVLTTVLQKGDAVVLGSLDGSKTSSLHFMHVPWYRDVAK
jgi:hypothetical protein